MHEHGQPDARHYGARSRVHKADSKAGTPDPRRNRSRNKGNSYRPGSAAKVPTPATAPKASETKADQAATPPAIPASSGKSDAKRREGGHK